MRIVHVVRSAGVGGVETHVLNLCRLQREAGDSVSVVSLVGGPVQSRFRELDIPVTRLGDQQAWSFRMVPLIWDLKAVLRRLRPDLVHLHGARPIFIGAVAAKLAGCRVIVSTLHGSYRLMALDHDGQERVLVYIAAKLAHYIGFALSDRILVDCLALESEVRSVYRGFCRSFEIVKQKKVRLAYNSVDVAEIDASLSNRDLRSELGLKPDAVVFGTVSRLDEPKKGLGILLRAFAPLTRVAGSVVHLMIAGDGWAQELLQRQVETLHIAEHVSFLGFYPNLADVYRALDVFILPSLSEGFPTVILEAMAFSLPVIATDVGGCREAVTDGRTGCLVSAGDIEQLRLAMESLGANAVLRENYGRNARQDLQTKFTIPTMGQAVRQTYREIGDLSAH